MAKASLDASEAQQNTPNDPLGSTHILETPVFCPLRQPFPSPNLQSQRKLEGADLLSATPGLSTVTPPMEVAQKHPTPSKGPDSPTSKPLQSLTRSTSASSILSPSYSDSKRTREAAEDASPLQARIRRSKRLKGEEPGTLPANTSASPILEPPPPTTPPVPPFHLSQVSTPLQSGSCVPPSLNRRRVIVSPTLSDFDDEALAGSGLEYDHFEGLFLKPSSESRVVPKRVSGRPAADRSYSWPSLPPRWKKE